MQYLVFKRRVLGHLASYQNQSRAASDNIEYYLCSMTCILQPENGPHAVSDWQQKNLVANQSKILQSSKNIVI